MSFKCLGLALILINPALGQDPDPAQERAQGRVEGLEAAQAVAPGRPLLSGVLGAGTPAGLGLAIGTLPTLGAPVLAGLACGALGCVSAAWAWEMAQAPAPTPPEGHSEAWLAGYAEGWEAGTLRARRRWVYLAGGLTTAGLAGVYVGVTALTGARSR